MAIFMGYVPAVVHVVVLALKFESAGMDPVAEMQRVQYANPGA